MVERTISDEIVIIVQDEIQQIPKSQQCVITKTYDQNFVDIITDTDQVLKYVNCYGDNSVGNNAILTFLDSDYNRPVVITDNSGFNKELLRLIGEINEYILK